MHLIIFLAWAGSAVSLWGTARYLRGIMTDGTQPNLASWLAWLAANAALAVVALMHGAHAAALFDGLAGLGNAGVLAIALWKRAVERPQGQSDWMCLGAAAVCSAVLVLFPRLATLGALLAMAANLIATWPTMVHAWYEPHAETWQLFAANAGASLLGLVGVAASGGTQLTTVAGPLVALLGNLTLTAITLGRRYQPLVTSEVAGIEAGIAAEIADIETGIVGGIAELENRLGTEAEPTRAE